MSDFRQLRRRKKAIAPVFPPAFPFLLLPAGAVDEHAVALLPDSRFQRQHRRVERVWRELVASVQAVGPDGLPADERARFAADLEHAADRFGDAVIAWSANDISGIPFWNSSDLLSLRGRDLWRDGEIRLTALLEARLIDDPDRVRRAWKLAEPLAYLSWDGDRAGGAGTTSVYRTAGGFWADWSGETGDIFGPFDDLASALGSAGVSEGGHGLTFELEVEPAFAGEAGVLDALAELAKDADGVWFNGVPLSVDDRRLLRPRSDTDEPLRFVP